MPRAGPRGPRRAWPVQIGASPLRPPLGPRGDPRSVLAGTPMPRAGPRGPRRAWTPAPRRTSRATPCVACSDRGFAPKTPARSSRGPQCPAPDLAGHAVRGLTTVSSIRWLAGCRKPFIHRVNGLLNHLGHNTHDVPARRFRRTMETGSAAGSQRGPSPYSLLLMPETRNAMAMSARLLQAPENPSAETKFRTWGSNTDEMTASTNASAERLTNPTSTFFIIALLLP